MPEIFDLYQMAKTLVVPVVVSSTGKLSLAHLTESVEWEKHIDQAAVKAVINLQYANGILEYLPEGAAVYLFSEDMSTEILRGFLMERRVNARQGGKLQLEVYDHGIYLLKSDDDQVFRKMRADEIIRFLCETFEIPIGELANTQVVLDRQVYRGKKIWDMMVAALVETRKQGGGRYVLRFEKGKLYLRSMENIRPTTFVLEEGVNLVDVARVDSILDLKTQVKVIGPAASEISKAPVRALATNEEMKKRFGLLQHLEAVPGTMRKDKAEEEAKRLLEQLSKVKRQASATVIGMYDVMPGDPVFVRERITQMQGKYWVRAVKNQVARNVASSELLLEFDQFSLSDVEVAS